jgi:hypothetical protein
MSADGQEAGRGAGDRWATTSVAFRFAADAVEPGPVQMGPTFLDPATQQFVLKRAGEPVAVVGVVWLKGPAHCGGSVAVEPPHRGERD